MRYDAVDRNCYDAINPGSRTAIRYNQERSLMAGKKATQKTKKVGKTLCKLQKNNFIKKNLEEYKALVRDGRYVCRKCGRVAGREKNLCKGETL